MDEEIVGTLKPVLQPSMSLYTLIADFEGGTYISQWEAENLQQAIVSWAKAFSIEVVPHVDKQFRLDLIAEVDSCQTEGVEPVAIEGLKAVWCSSFCPQNRFLLLNIVETVAAIS